MSRTRLAGAVCIMREYQIAVKFKNTNRNPNNSKSSLQFCYMKIILATLKEIKKNQLGSGKNKTNFSDEHISGKAFFIVFTY